MLNGTNVVDIDATVRTLLNLCNSNFFFDGTLAEGSGENDVVDVSAALALSPRFAVVALLVATVAGAWK